MGSSSRSAQSTSTDSTVIQAVDQRTLDGGGGGVIGGNASVGVDDTVIGGNISVSTTDHGAILAAESIAQRGLDVADNATGSALSAVLDQSAQSAATTRQLVDRSLAVVADAAKSENEELVQTFGYAAVGLIVVSGVVAVFIARSGSK